MLTRRSQHGRPRVEGADIDEHAGPQPDALERGAIGVKRHLISGAAAIVVPGGGFHPRGRQRFVLEDVDRLHYFPSRAAVAHAAGQPHQPHPV